MYFQHLGSTTSTSTRTSSNFPPPHHYQLEFNWAFGPNLIHQPPQNHNNLMASSTSNFSSCSSSLMMPQLLIGSSYFGSHQFHHQLQLLPVEAATAAGPSLDFRLVNPRRRPRSGICFMLQASQNQDGTMTVRFIIKYLVNKPRLDSESEGAILLIGYGYTGSGIDLGRWESATSCRLEAS
ncbi:hypothetical protein PanWU01x14_322020 [Parasponia andersonii]|uniref:Uncharacterized protein n=1 Tax=Parasponia andersonii TaxID=3476 RepID=A0A2P5AL16_PARAD|nr:hypothetical protein PanWU01x14_322020 [Parasponia andersonii]